MNPLPDSRTPIYDALYAQWRADFRYVPGEQGPQDVCSAPFCHGHAPMDPAPRAVEQGHPLPVPRQLTGRGARGAVSVAASPPPFLAVGGQWYPGPPLVPTR
ncbi:hypothetical protein [Streptomyces sp. NPDC001508]|uniref:hypothetical protein n=1 Tax=Streptomyces sp. NPDC001508 TaxID=3154656 RepID=UPI00331B2E40